MEKLNCKIIQDLLPSYMDEVTSEGVRTMILEHLNECEQCKKVYMNLCDLRKRENEESLNKSDSFKEKLRGIRYSVLGFFIGLTLPVIAIALMFLISNIQTFIMYLSLL